MHRKIKQRICNTTKIMMMLAASAAVKCHYCQTDHKEVSKMMWGATEEELNELSAIVAETSFWSNVLHTQNYDHSTFVKELQQIGEHIAKNNEKK